MTKQKFDGHAKKYDTWFMENENLFNSEVNLYKKSLGSIKGKRILSVGCGSGLFESTFEEHNIEGIEPSTDMAEIAKERGLNVKIGTIENVTLEDNAYDIIYFNGSSSYIDDLKPAYKKCYDALKTGGKIILFDVPKESAFGFMYLLAKNADTFDHASLNDTMPKLPYPLELVKAGYWHTTEEKINILKELNMKDFEYYQTLQKNPMYTNEEIEEAIEGYKKGGYVSIIASK